MPIVNRQASYPTLGRVALGYLTQNEAGKTYPARSQTMVFSSDDEDLLTHVSKLLGGQVSPVPHGNEEAEQRWRVITTARELHIRLPSDDERAFQQWYERWGSGGIIRRCDGVTCQFALTTPNAPPERDVPCVCEAKDLPEGERCDPTTRLNAVVEELFTVPRMGLWQITSRGWDSAREIVATIDLLRAGGRVAGIPLLLRVEQKTRRARDGKTYEFPVFTLVSLVSFAQMKALSDAPARGFLPPGPTAPSEQPHSTAEPMTPAPTGRGERVPAEAAGSPAAPSGQSWQDSYLKTAAQIPGEDELKKIEYLATVCKEYVKRMGIPLADANALWLRIGSPEKTLDDYRRLYAVLSAESVGVPRDVAVVGVLALLPSEPVPF